MPPGTFSVTGGKEDMKPESLTANRHERDTEGTVQESAVQASHTSAMTPDL